MRKSSLSLKSLKCLLTSKCVERKKKSNYLSMMAVIIVHIIDTVILHEREREKKKEIEKAQLNMIKSHDFNKE